MKYGFTGLLSAAGLTLALMTACQRTVPVGPAAEGEGSPAKGAEVNPKIDGATGDWSLSDSCFPGRGTALPEACGTVDTQPKETVVKTDVPVATPVVVTGSGNWTLNDPCFPGRGGPLPKECTETVPQ
jgi:hypothetical protein